MTEQFRLYYIGRFLDLKNRHSLLSSNVVRESDRINNSAVFNGTSSYIEVLTNLEDFSLGSSPVTSKVSTSKWTHVKDNNQFTIDCWIKPVFGSDRYYPICSSFSKLWWPLGYGVEFNVGWVLQLDCSTGKLQMINHCTGNLLIFESTLTVKNNTWSHIAISAYRTPDLYSNKFFYINGKYDAGTFKSSFSGLTPQEFKSYASWSNCLGALSTFLDTTKYGAEAVKELVTAPISKYDIVIKPHKSIYTKLNTEAPRDVDKVGIVVSEGSLYIATKGSITEKGYLEYEGWNWKPGAHLYIDSVSGRLTSVKPSRGPVLDSIALAITATKVWFFPFWELGKYETPDKTDYAEPLDKSLNELDLVYTYLGSSGKYVSFRYYQQEHKILKIGIVVEDGGLTKQTSMKEDIVIKGYVTNLAWTFIPGLDIYIDASYNLTQTRPTSTEPIKACGYAITNNKIWFAYGWKTSIVTSIAMGNIGDIVVKNPDDNTFSKTRYISTNYTLGIISKQEGSKFEVVTDGNVTKTGWKFEVGKSVYVDSVSRSLTQLKSPTTVLIGSAYGESQIWFCPTWNEDEYCPLYIGVGPRSYYFDKFLKEEDEFNLRSGYHFKGAIRDLRICNTPRFSVEGNPFNPQNLSYETVSTTSSTTTTASSTASTTIKPVESIPFEVKTDDLLSMRLQSFLFDYSNRHVMVPIGNLPASVIESVFSFRFNNSGYLKIINNLEDFSLGATLLPSSNGNLAEGNNVFTIDFWIYPELIEGKRFLGICSSFGTWFFPFVEGTNISMISDTSVEYKMGWSLQIDSVTGKLQMVGYNRGNYSQTILESSFSIPFNVWSHVCVMSWRDGGAYPKRFYLNGVPDLTYNPITHNYPEVGAPFVDSNMYWCNGVQDSTGTSESYSYFYLGASPKTDFTDPIEPQADKFNIEAAYKFKGALRNFRISSVNRFGFYGFEVPDNDLSTSTTTTASTSTTRTTTTIGTTTFTTTVNPLIKLYGKPISSNSRYDGRPEFAFDGNDDTAWKPILPDDSWVGVSFIEDE